MMKDIIKHLHSLNLETSLLEANDWDESKCLVSLRMLSEYLSVCEKTDLCLVKADLDLIFNHREVNAIIEQLGITINHLKEQTKK